jgi:hypothetical protein
MAYADDWDKKFGELYSAALADLKKTEANFEEDLKDADLSEPDLKNEVLTSVNAIWETAGVRLSSYVAKEESLRRAEAQVEESVREFIDRGSDSVSAETSQPVPRDPLSPEAQEFRSMMEKEMRLDVLRLDLKNFGDEIDLEMIKQIKERIRLAINNKLPIRYSTILNMFSAPGLAELIDPIRMIDTSAKTSLLYMLDTMEGGCIGIAGSRGAGKSTLIQMCCGEQRTLERINTVKVLPIYTTAPVQYESRDFILYLFSTVCRRVISMDGIPYDEWTIPEIEGFSEPRMPNRTLRRLVGLVPDRGLAYVGAGLVSAGIILAVLMVLITLSTTSGAAQAADAVFKALEIKPSQFLFWGGFLLLATFLIQKIKSHLDEEAQYDFPRTYKDFTDASETKRQEWQEKAGNIREKGILNNFRKRLEDDSRNSPLKKEAINWLKELKFQQSFTSGWSGALKLPVGLEGGIQKAATLSQKQMSNPEIVAHFVKFLKSVSATEYKVIIGIDELDKMESDEDAQKFLNEIKSIFGLQNCFYLISVSENAMNKFERRGLPFRDVFDSSFDNVVYVDYLNYKTAKALIERRVIGKPIPFIYLSYCLSGGLPRDLIRNFRNLLELNQKARSELTGSSLDALCREMIGSDIKAKVRAVVSAAKKIETTSHSNELVQMIFELDTATLNETHLLLITEKLLCWWPDKITPETTEDEKIENANRRKLEKLSLEMGSYLYFLLTVLQFFNADLKELTLRRAAVNGDLDQLAKSRQMLGVNPNLAVVKLNMLRTKWDKKEIKIQKPVTNGNNLRRAAKKQSSPAAGGVKVDAK